MSKQLFYYTEELQNLYDEKSFELFNKPLNELVADERALLEEYITDILDPVWRKNIFKGIVYFVSNVGEIKNEQGKLLKVYGHSQKKYHIVWLEGFQLSIHRAVAINFIPNPENKTEVNHINGNKFCNWYKNLEWNTRQENATHAKLNGLMLKGSKQPIAKHTEEEAHAVCKLAEQGLKPKAIMKKLSLSKSFIIGILYRNEWKHVSSLYKMPKPKKFNNIEQVHKICKLLEQGKRDFEVAKELNVKWQDVNSIHKGEAWRRISNLYNIPGLEKDHHNDLKLSEKIEEVLKSGVTDSYKVLEILNEECTKHKRDYVLRIKRRMGLID